MLTLDPAGATKSFSMDTFDSGWVVVIAFSRAPDAMSIKKRARGYSAVMRAAVPLIEPAML